MITGGFGKYILAITGAVVLLSIADIIIPKGRTAKYIKSALSIFLILIIINPIAQIKTGEISLGGIFNEDANYTDINFSNNLNRIKVEEMEKSSAKHLKNKGFDNITIKILYSINGQNINIDFVHIDLTKAALTGNGEHINIIDKIKNYVAEYLNISIEKVFTYGAG